jgi:predicted transcriptional regulator
MKSNQERIEGLIALVKEQAKTRNGILALLKESHKTVPEISEETGIPSSIVLWNIAAMRKYGKVAEAEIKGDYPTYRIVEEE